MIIYKIADLNIGIENHSDFTKEYLKDYLSSDTEYDFCISITKDIIEYEKQNSEEDFPHKYYEATAILRNICKKVVSDYDGFFLHCSCLEYEGNAYVFTAKSGTGKSTHSRLWREVFGDKVTMINDDKPIIRLIDDKFYIYGTPWNGKHHISNNIKSEIKAIYYLSQGSENAIAKSDPISSISKILSQTVLPDDKKSMENLLDMVEKLVSSTPVFDLSCTISHDAVRTVLNSLKET
ncbi:MAG: hypothetical protein E7513_07965 [Ruminococcaceae bacterium]|nr:hypothetical protein [Oscillospiraceae bacterium]